MSDPAPKTCKWKFDGFGRMPHWHTECEPGKLASAANDDGTCQFCKKPVVYEGRNK